MVYAKVKWFSTGFSFSGTESVKLVGNPVNCISNSDCIRHRFAVMDIHPMPPLHKKDITLPGNQASTMKQLSLIVILLLMTTIASAQTGKYLTRIARITIDSTKVDRYLAMLKEQMDAAVRLEPGVISYTVYSDKINPAKITIVEVYADNNAYLAHREAPHFKKYKEASSDLVLSLELSEVDVPLAVGKNKKVATQN